MHNLSSEFVKQWSGATLGGVRDYLGVMWEESEKLEQDPDRKPLETDTVNLRQSTQELLRPIEKNSFASFMLLLLIYFL